jgi:hypothetical protein
LVKYLPTMIEALGSIPNTTKLNKNLWLFKKKIGSPDKKKNQQRNIKIKWNCRSNELTCTFFLPANGTFSNIDHILGHKESLNRYKKNKNTSDVLSNHNEIKLENNNKRNYRKYYKTWRQNNTLLNDHWIIEGTGRGEI